MRGRGMSIHRTIRWGSAANNFQCMYAAQQGELISRNNMPASLIHRQGHSQALYDIGIYEGDGDSLLLMDDDINRGLHSGQPRNNNEMRGSARHTEKAQPRSTDP